MATQDENTPISLPAGANVSFSQRLWSEEVALAWALEGTPLDTREIAYEFSNGQQFYTPE